MSFPLAWRPHPTRRSTRLPAVVLITLAATLTACSSLPRDPDGTLERIRTTHVLRVGVAHHPPYVELSPPENTPAGREPELVTRYAEHLGARIEWRRNSEAALIEDLTKGDLDLVIAGLQDTSPWAQEAALTRPYAETTDPDGTPRAHVVALPIGENAFLVDLERWLDANAGNPR